MNFFDPLKLKLNAVCVLRELISLKKYRFIILL